MKTILTSALILATLSGAAFAASPVAGVSTGAVQLALSAGVEPGRYTTPELIKIIDAQRENDTQAAQFYLSGSNRASADASNTAGANQLALAAGVEPGRFTLAELIQITDAQRENDTATLNFILSGANRVSDDSVTATPGRLQLAASAGVNASDYTLAELVALQPTAND